MGITLDLVNPKDPQCNGFAKDFVKSICRLIYASITENKDRRKELSGSLLQYPAKPHLKTDCLPAEMVFNGSITTVSQGIK